jgi:hypothetical protein
MAGGSSACVCLKLSFECSDESVFSVDLFQEGYINTGYGEKPYYIGSYSGNNYIIYWNFAINGWSFEDVLNPGVTIFSSDTNSSVCNFINWDIADTTDFEFCSGGTAPILSYKGDQPCPNPTGDTCGDCSCWFFSADSSYTISYYDCNNEGKAFTLSSGGTSSFCLKGIPIVVPPNVSNFYSAKTSNNCFLDCVPTGYCECIIVSNEDDNLEFYVGGTINGKTFWISDVGYRIYWDDSKWVFEIDGQVSATTTGGGICPPTGSINTNWTPSIFVDDFTLSLYDCYPEFNESKKCWSITATTDDEVNTFYDNLNSPPKKVPLLYTDDVMVVCAYNKPISTYSGTTVIEITGSCYTICDSIDICGCVRTSLICNLEAGGGITQISNLTPSGTINGKPFYVNDDKVLFYSGVWIYYDTTSQLILAQIAEKDIECPYDGQWQIDDSEICNCVGDSPISFSVLPKICPQLPTPTPTPTPTPIPYVIPTCNECIPTTVFTMDVECIPTNPTSPTSADGSISLSISGGTAPYTTTWSNGNTNPDIFNLTEGSYTATTVDYYGDFTAVTICELVAVRPTTTTTTTITPTPTGNTLCMSISTIQSTGTTTESIQFEPDVVVNGKLSWVSSGGDSLIWDNTSSQWKVNFNPVRSYFVLSLNPAFPPLNNWIVVGLSGTATVVEGECPIMINLKTISKNVSFKSLINKGNDFNDLF